MQILIGGGRKPRLKLGKRDVDVLLRAREILSAIGGAMYDVDQIGEDASEASQAITAVLEAVERMVDGVPRVEPLDGQKELPFEAASAVVENETAANF
jgi:hypothetical protein